MTIFNKLKLIVLIPIIILASYFFITSYINFEKSNTLKTVLSNNAKLSLVLTEIGKERDLTAIYEGSNQKEFTDSLLKQRLHTDAVVLDMGKDLIVKDTTYMPAILRLLGESNSVDLTLYKTLFSNTQILATIREKVDVANSNFKQVFFEEYKQKVSTPLLANLLQIRNLALDTEISSLISTLSQLYIAKENAGLERGLVSYYMTKKDSMSIEEVTLWDNFKTKANIFDIENVSNDRLRQELGKIFEKLENSEILTELAETSAAIKRDIANRDYEEEVMDWFALQTQKISLLSKAELMVSNVLWEKSNAYREKQILLFAIAAFILLLSFILVYTTPRDISSNISELEESLNKAIDEMKNSKQYLGIKTSDMGNINLTTHAGTKKASRFIDTLVKAAKSHTYPALEAQEIKPPKMTIHDESIQVKIPSKNILIAKKTLLEQKILSKVLENLGYDYTILESMDLLEEKVQSGHYNILFTDVDLLIDNINKHTHSLTIITTNKTKEEIDTIIKEKG